MKKIMSILCGVIWFGYFVDTSNAAVGIGLPSVIKERVKKLDEKVREKKEVKPPVMQCGTIKGTITYTGTKTGQLIVAVFDNFKFSGMSVSMYSTESPIFPQAYEISIFFASGRVL